MRVDTDDFARPCSCGKEHHIDVKEILIEEGAVEELEREMSEGYLKELSLRCSSVTRTHFKLRKSSWKKFLTDARCWYWKLRGFTRITMR